MKSMDTVRNHIEQIAALFPNVITETRDEKGNIKRAVDFELLKQELSEVLVEGDKERYQLTWPGKKQAMLNANTPIEKTLRPVKEESVDWENTQNLYIEGDNLEVLKLLQESYLNKIKMIYIDPPYNTGKDFLYKDDFRESTAKYLKESGQIDESGNRLFQNTEANGRFHSDWLSMMYPRLKVARNLLTEDGVIFISIDDHEVYNLRKLCNEIFGESNFVAQCVRKRRESQANLSKNISPIHEYLLIYSKNNGKVLNKIAANMNEEEYKNPDNDVRGPYVTMPCTNKGGPIYTITTPTGKKITDEWRFKEETYYQLLAENKIVFPRGGDGKPRYKLFLSEKKAFGVLANTWLDQIGSNQEATREIKEIFDGLVFDTPKPTGLIKFCLELATNKDSIILDFFSGSATTAHAVMQMNAIDGGKRRYIMVQLPERTNESSDAYKAGYRNICEIGKERIRRAAKKIKEETNANIDYGFRVFRVDSSNMKEVYYTPDQLEQGDLYDLISNIKEDRTDEDLLIQVMLDLGLELSLAMEKKEIDGFTVHYVAGNSLIACFDENISENAIKQIAMEKPLYVVFRDWSFADDAARINVEEIFKSYSPHTDIRVL